MERAPWETDAPAQAPADKAPWETDAPAAPQPAPPPTPAAEPHRLQLQALTSPTKNADARAPYDDQGDPHIHPDVLDHTAFNQRVAINEHRKSLIERMLEGGKKGMDEAIEATPSTVLTPEARDFWEGIGAISKPGAGWLDWMIRLPGNELVQGGSAILGASTQGLHALVRGAAGFATGGNESAMDDASGILSWMMSEGGATHMPLGTEFVRTTEVNGQVVHEPVGPHATPADVQVSAAGIKAAAERAPNPEAAAKAVASAQVPVHEVGELGIKTVEPAATPKLEDATVEGEKLSRKVLEQKVKQLYEEQGVHPAEVLADATRDPALAKDMATDNELLPSRYTGIDPDARASTSPPAGIPPDLHDVLSLDAPYPTKEAPTVMAHPEFVPSRWTRATMTVGEYVKAGLDRAGGDLVNMLQVYGTPMASRKADFAARAAVKDVANVVRTMQYRYRKMHNVLTKHFNERTVRMLDNDTGEYEEVPSLKAMWEAADQDSVLAQQGEAPRHVDALPDMERYAIRQLQRHSEQAWVDAQKYGLVSPETQGLPFYTPRMFYHLINAFDADAAKVLEQRPTTAGKFRTSTAQLMRRYHLLAEDTEEAAQEHAKPGQSLAIVRDIRTLPLATQRLWIAIHGKMLINMIRETEKSLDQPAVIEGDVPRYLKAKDYYHDPSEPAFFKHELTYKRNPLTDKMEVRTDDEGIPVWKTTPLRIHKSYQGPIKSFLQHADRHEYVEYYDLMKLKARINTINMLSPAVHNSTIFSRAFPTAGKGYNFVAMYRLYRDGNRLRKDPAYMQDKINNGLAPILGKSVNMDISSIVDEGNYHPSNSWTASALGHTLQWVPGFTKEGVINAVNKAGKFSHETLLWDRVADIQMGLAKYYEDLALKDGQSPQTASRVGAHMANRYAGALPKEAMSGYARQLLNFGLFSRSYTTSVAGSFKDMFVGLPRDISAQIMRDKGLQEMLKARDFVQRKSIGIFVRDVGAGLIWSSIFGIATRTLITGANDLSDELKDALDRWHRTMARVDANPAEALNPLEWTYYQLPMADNETNKFNREELMLNDSGRAIYARNPLGGKVIDDMLGWMLHPEQTAMNKESAFAHMMTDGILGKDYKDTPIMEPGGHWYTNAFWFAWHMFKLTQPFDMEHSVYDLLLGNPSRDQKKADTLKLIGPFFGLNISQGWPGGPAAGDAHADEKDLEAESKWYQDTIREKLDAGDKQGAHELMDRLKMDDGLQNWFVTSQEHPEYQYNKKKFFDLLEKVDPMERMRIEDSFRRWQRMMDRKKELEKDR